MIFALWMLMAVGVIAAIAIVADFDWANGLFEKLPKKTPSMGKSRLVRLEEKIDILDGEVRRAVRMGTDFYEQAKSQLKEEQEKCLILEANKNELEARLKILTTDNESLQKEKNKLTEQLDMVNKELSAALSKADKLSKQLTKQKALRGDGEFELEKLREEVEVLRNELEYERNN